MKNVTVSMEEAVADWARIEAARRNTSVSRMIGEMLAEKMRHDDSYQRAMREALEFRSFGSSKGPYLTRDEIYDRGTQWGARETVMSVFLDTNVLLYCVDDRDPDKRDQARRWVTVCWQRQCGRLSTQVLNEYYVNVRKKFPRQLSQGDARAEIRRYQHWKPWAIDQPTVETAWAVESRYGFNYWDALMVAAAQQQGCTLLLTEDLQHGQQVDSLRVVDPFKSGPELLDAAA